MIVGDRCVTDGKGVKEFQRYACKGNIHAAHTACMAAKQAGGAGLGPYGSWQCKKRVDQAPRIHQYIVSLYSGKQILHSAQDDRPRRNTVRLAVRAELVEAHLPFDRLRASALNRTALGPGVWRLNPPLPTTR